MLLLFKQAQCQTTNLPWEQNVILTSKYMGPNGLPAPPIKKGLLDSAYRFDNWYTYHQSKYDHTQSWFSYLYLPIVAQKISLVFFMVPYETFKLTPRALTYRRAYESKKNGQSIGDLYVSTQWQLVSNKKRWPDLLLSMNIKTASGNNEGLMRFTDTPGYYFDLSGHKQIALSAKHSSYIHLYALLGFYVYQMYNSQYRQNDAVMYGFGIDWEQKSLRIGSHITGYQGYLNLGDIPLVWRNQASISLIKHWCLLLEWEKGVVDYPFVGYKMGFSYQYMPKKRKL